MNEKTFSRRKAIASLTAGGAGLALANFIGNDTAIANEGSKKMTEGQTSATAVAALRFRLIRAFQITRSTATAFV